MRLMDVTLSYLRARVVVLIAALAVVVSGGFIVRAFMRHVTTPCRGTLEEVSLDDLTPRLKRNEAPATGGDLTFAWDRGDDTKSALDPRAFANVRVEWIRTDAPCACSAVSIPWASYTKGQAVLTPNNLMLFQDTDTGLFVVHEASGKDIVAFRKTERSGSVLKKSLIVAPNNIGLAILLGAFGALLAALYLLARAQSYAQSISTWKPGILRPDGVVESETGATLGRIAPRVRFLDGDVLVRPQAYEGRDVYREMPMFDRGDIAIGNHAFWTRGTLRRLGDARTLAILATATTVLAMIANQFAG